MALHVKVDLAALERAIANSGPVLNDLGQLCHAQAESILTASKPLVPVAEEHQGEQPRLVNTGFTDGPEKNPKHLSVTATAGYEHPQAGAIHEGFHYGFQTVNPPPHFLKKPAKKGRSAFKKRIAAQLMATLEKLFPHT